MSKKDTVATVKGLMVQYAGAEKGSGAKITNKLAEEAYDAVIAAVVQELETTGQAKISGFGNFSVVKLAAGTKRNPDTGASVEVAERNTVRWAVSKVLRFTDGIQNAPVPVKEAKEEDAE
jgi:nucleoid DNA-binding protein